MSADLLSEFSSFYSQTPKAAVSEGGTDSDLGVRGSPRPKASLPTDAGVDWNPWSAEEEQNPWGSRERSTRRSVNLGGTEVEDIVDWGDFAEAEPAPSRSHGQNAETLEVVVSKAGPESWEQHGADQRNFAIETTEGRDAAPPAAAKTDKEPAPDFDPWDQFEQAQLNQKSQEAQSPAAPPVEAEGTVWPFVPKRSLSYRNESQIPQRSRSTKPRDSPRPMRDENVLFDAENITDEEDEDDDDFTDDFGDFETAESEAPKQPLAISVKPPQPSQPEPSLIDFDFEPAPHNDSASKNEQSLKLPVRETTTAFDPFGDFDDTPQDQTTISLNNERQQELRHDNAFTQSAKDYDKRKSQSFSTAHISDDFARTESNFEESPSAWESWEEQDTTARDAGRTKVGQSEAMAALPVLLNTAISSSSGGPPSNVPPPAILLTLFPPLLTVIKAELFDHLHELAPLQSTRNPNTVDPTLKVFLTSCLTIATVLGRIIAGRKLRWKRDTILSQSMRIGQAGTGKTGGMKLASIDKNENVREEREVTHAVRLWKGQLGKLKSTLAAAGITQPIPEISENLPVRTAQPAESAIIASKQCAICAVKRNERVNRVDFDVQDSFGEWWIEHWGHRDCKNFWDSHEKDLISR